MKSLHQWKKVLLFILFISTLVIVCTQDKSNEDKMKSNYSGKEGLKKLLFNYSYARMYFGRNFMGDPLCGGDPIGTVLGLNNDRLRPLYLLEMNKTYQFVGYEGLVSNGVKDINYGAQFKFLTIPIYATLTVKATLLEECIDSKSDYNPFVSSVLTCQGLNLLPAKLKLYQSNEKDKYGYTYLSKKNSFEIYTLSNPNSYVYIDVYVPLESCKYQIEIKGE